jgi:hypothetical protein
VIPIGKTSNEEDEIREVWKSWTTFDCKECKCANEEDKEHIMRTISVFQDGAEGFNSEIMGFANEIRRNFETIAGWKRQSLDGNSPGLSPLSNPQSQSRKSRIDSAAVKRLIDRPTETDMESVTVV